MEIAARSWHCFTWFGKSCQAPAAETRLDNLVLCKGAANIVGAFAVLDQNRRFSSYCVTAPRLLRASEEGTPFRGCSRGQRPRMGPCSSVAAMFGAQFAVGLAEPPGAFEPCAQSWSATRPSGERSFINLQDRFSFLAPRASLPASRSSLPASRSPPLAPRSRSPPLVSRETRAWNEQNPGRS